MFHFHKTFDVSNFMFPVLELETYEIDIVPAFELDVMADSFDFTPTVSGASASGFGSASAGFSGFASGSGVSSISVSASSFVGNDGQSFSTIEVSALGDNVGGTGFAQAGDDFDGFSFGGVPVAPSEPEPLVLAPIDLEPIELDIDFSSFDLSSFVF